MTGVWPWVVWLAFCLLPVGVVLMTMGASLRARRLPVYALLLLVVLLVLAASIPLTVLGIIPH